MAAQFTLADAVVRITASTDNLNRALGNADKLVNQKMGNILKYTRAAGQAMTIAGVALAGGLLYAAKGAADFDKAMREVNTMMGLGEGDFQRISKEVRELSKTMGVDAVESARALYQIISAGVPEENAIAFLQVATKAAIGGVTDTKTAVDGLTTVINAFGMKTSDAEHVADLMFTTVKGGKTTFAELAATLFNVAPMAASAGVSFDEVSAALSTLTKQGVPTAQATTQIRSAIVAMVKPTKEMEAAIKAAGYESATAMIKQLGLVAAFEKLRGTTDGSNESLVELFGRIEGVNGVLGVTGENAISFAKDLDSMKDSAGASDAAFQEMEESAARKYEHLMAELADVRIEIGNQVIPVLIELSKQLTPMLKGLSEWIEKNPQLGGQLAMLAGFLLVGGPILLGLNQMLRLFTLMQLAAPGLTGALGKITGGAVSKTGLAGMVGQLGLIVGVAGLGWELGRWIDEISENTAFGRWIDRQMDWIQKWIDKIKKLLEWLGILEKRPELGPGTKWGSEEEMLADPRHNKLNTETQDFVKQHRGYAAGGTISGAMQLVGERGPELVSLPRGSRVFSNEESRAMMKSVSNVQYHTWHIKTNSIRDIKRADLLWLARQTGEVFAQAAG